MNSHILLWLPPYFWSSGPTLPAPLPPDICLALPLLCSPCQSPPGPIRGQFHLTNQQIKEIQSVFLCALCVVHVYLLKPGVPVYYLDIQSPFTYGCVGAGWEPVLNSS